MPRLPRNIHKAGFFHIMVQGINKSYIFQTEMQKKEYIKLMKECNKKIDIKIIAYCIMNNHAHILLEFGQMDCLSKYMQRLNTKFGRYYNDRHERVGYVFRDRYKSEGIYCEEQLYNCIKYIYDNPVKAGICSTPEEYPYSNYKKINIIYENNYSFIDIDENDKFNCKTFIDNFLKENNIELEELTKNKLKLEELIIMLKKKHDISLRKISEELHLSREIVRRLYNN